MNSDTEAGSFWKSRQGFLVLICLAIVAFFVLTEHRAHFFGALPYLLLLACPLLHIFMHRDHGGHQHKHPPQKGDL